MTAQVWWPFAFLALLALVALVSHRVGRALAPRFFKPSTTSEDW